MAQCEECEGTGEVAVTHYWNANGQEMELLDEEFIMCPACRGNEEDEEGEKEGG